MTTNCRPYSDASLQSLEVVLGVILSLILDSSAKTARKASFAITARTNPPETFVALSALAATLRRVKLFDRFIYLSP